MINNPSLTKCLKRWKDEFMKHHGKPLWSVAPDDFWEGETAYKELKIGGWLPFVMLDSYDPDEEWNPVMSAIELLMEELDFYLGKKGKIVSTNQERRNFNAFLGKMIKQFEKGMKEFPQRSPILKEYTRNLVAGAGFEPATFGL